MSQNILIPLLVFAACLSFAFGAYLIMSWYMGYRGSVQNRLQSVEANTAIQTREELMRVRRSRGLSGDGHYLVVPLLAMNKLLLQSGSSLGLPGVFAIMLGIGSFVFFALRIFAIDMGLSMASGLVTGISVPLIVLRAMRDARRTRFEQQLPDAIDVIVRSVRAGHAISVAITAAGKHLPEPIASEFRLTAAEVTYGLDLETALINLRSRVGQADLALIVLAVSIQSKTGGNLAEVLSNMAKVIRARLKLRRKAQALAAEGKFSAILLSVMPFVLFGVLWLISPNYYNDIWGNPYVKPTLGISVVWMLIGDYVMYRMVRFSI